MLDTKKRLLIVDDEHDIISPLNCLFQENGFEVVSFTDPLLALERFKPQYYDLLILDIKMPQMNGFELYRQIRRKDDSVKVCFLTALGDLRNYEQYKNEAYPKPNERHFIAKPIPNDEIIRRVNEILTKNSSV
jgi:two-component system catabolic regulation response regulator CreB/two-component system response regulator ChvI